MRLLPVALVIGLGGLGWTLRPRHSDPPRADDRVQVVSTGVPAKDAAAPPPPPALSVQDWSGPEGVAVLRALDMPPDARIRDVTVFAQVLCGRVQPAADQPFQRFAYVRTAHLAALDDGTADFAQSYAQLCR